MCFSLSQVTKDGHGLLEVWVKQLQQFKGVGHDTAAAIAQVYPSPRMLMEVQLSLPYTVLLSYLNMR